MSNTEIREEMKKKGLEQWRLGALLGVSEATICRKMRMELPAEEKERILHIIRNFEKKE